MIFDIYFIFVWAIVMAYIAIGNYIYFFKILPMLGKGPSFMPFNQQKDIQEYLKILIERNEYPWFYHILNNIKLITLIIFL